MLLLKLSTYKAMIHMLADNGLLILKFLENFGFYVSISALNFERFSIDGGSVDSAL